MIDQSQEVSEITSEETKPEVTIFKEEITKADGTLIPLRKTTTDGKKLYIAARCLRNPRGNENENIYSKFWGWEEKDMSMHPMTGVMLVDVYAQSDGKIVPLGHMDWWLHDDYANGGGNMHAAPLAREEHEKLASERWHKYDYTAFKVDYEYHKQGIGSLMVATSALTLPAIGIKKFYTGGLLDPAVKTYERFGIRDSDFPDVAQPFDRHLLIERLSQSPQVNKTIVQFV